VPPPDAALRAAFYMKCGAGLGRLDTTPAAYGSLPERGDSLRKRTASATPAPPWFSCYPAEPERL